MAKRRNRWEWGLVAGVAAVVMVGIGMLGVRVRPLWVAKYRGDSAKLCGASLSGAPLAGARLDEADLTGADLNRADLSTASLFATKLRDARLRGAVLRGAYLERADLRGADLRGADFEDASVGGADFAGADLRGADLRVNCWWEPGQTIEETTIRITGARYDTCTLWPDGFAPLKHGAVLVKWRGEG